MWYFRVMGRGEINQDPTQEDYFNTDHLENFSDALVRESIQNSLDAKVKESSEPVTVRITFPEGKDCPTPAIASQFFEHLHEHIQAAEVITDPPGVNDPISYLVVEDFGTKGLIGDPMAADDPPEGEGVDFYYFWRNIGRGKKEGVERGRWGLGKTMFPASSRIHSFFGLTVRRDDGRRLLMGQSTLSIHHINGRKHAPYGYFGDPDGDDGFVVPIEDSDISDTFSILFSVSREMEPGLSVVIPFPRAEITPAQIIRSVIHHYFFPILSGELEVEVVSEGEGTSINRDSIESIVRTFADGPEDEFVGTLQLAKWYLAQKESDIFKANEQTPNRSPNWTEELFGHAQLDRFAEALDTQRPIAIRVPVHVIPPGRESTLSYFDLVLQRDARLERPLDYFIRSGVTISGIHSLRESGIRALVIARDTPIVTLLGDSENPAHTEWQDRSRKFVGKYRVGKSTLGFVKDAPRGFLRLLNKRSEVIDDTALRHIFPDSDSNRNSAPPTPSPAPSPDPTDSPRPDLDIARRPKLFTLSRLEGGFSVRLTEHGIAALPMSLRVDLAYDVRRNNPFKRWVSADFDLNNKKGHIELTDAENLETGGNYLRLRPTSKNFYLKVSGFDPKRDLIVDLNEEATSDASQV